MPKPLLEIQKDNTNSEFDRERQSEKKVQDSGYWEVRGSNGRILVDIEKAREAMRYAMEQHAKARRQEHLEGI